MEQAFTTLLRTCLQACRISHDQDALDAFRNTFWGAAHRMIAKHVVVEDGSRFPLDVGSGKHAQLARALTAAGGAIGQKVIVTSIDNNEEHVSDNADRFTNILLVHHDVHDPLGFQNGLFDGLTSSFCMEYVQRKRIRTVLQQLGRVLKNGSPVAFAVYALSFEDDDLVELLDTGSEDWNHMPGRVLKEHMLACGYRDVRVESSQCHEIEEQFPGFSEMTLFSVVTGVYQP